MTAERSNTTLQQSAHAEMFRRELACGRQALPQALHMVLAAFAACGFAVSGIHAWLLLRRGAGAFHRNALKIALWVGGCAAFLQPISGDYLAQRLARNQPVKLAAMEGQFQTERGAPIRIGGIPNEDERRTAYAIEIPYGLSLLAFHDPNAEVRGLEAFERSDWPPVAIVHIAFQIMVAAGVTMMALAVAAIWKLSRHRLLDSKKFIRLLVWMSPIGFIALEAGWVVTEVGRQPWIIQGVMRTAEAVTPVPGLIVPFFTFTLLYLFLAAVVAWLLVRQFRET